MRTLRLTPLCRALAVVVTLTLVPSASQASVGRRLSLDELVEHSSDIVVGRCTSVRSAWDRDHERILSTATYDVAQTIKGDARETVVVESLGGVVDDVAMYVPGMPAFAPGRDEVLFLSGSGDVLRITGMAQGQVCISRPPADYPGIDRRLNDLELVGPDDARLAPGGLSAFIAAVRTVVRRSAR